MDNQKSKDYANCNVEELINLNIQYQKLGNEFKECRTSRLKKYIDPFKRGDIKKFLDEIRYRNYARTHFSTGGNRAETITYTANSNNTNGKIAVYSCIAGKYDHMIEPLTNEENIDYFMFTDQEVPETSIWKKIDIKKFPEYKRLTAKDLNRRIKMIPYDYLTEYAYSVYVDGNIKIIYGINNIINNLGNASLAIHYHPVRDCIYDEGIAVIHYKKADSKLVKTQLEQYQKKGFPRHNGMTENSIIVRKHNNKDTENIMRLWWKEYEKYPTRDQFSLSYLMWENKYLKSNFISLGNNLEKNPYFNRVQKHLL